MTSLFPGAGSGWITAFISFLFGSIVGSFLNVCIYRLPRGESIISPSSHCPGCQKALLWYDNIPFLSYIGLKGRCRHCHQGISFRYFVVEFLTAILFLSLFLKFGLSWNMLIYLVFISGLIVATFTDFDHLIIPDVVTLPGLLLGLILSTVYPSIQRAIHPWSNICTSPGEGFLASLIGALLGGLSLYAIGALGGKVFKKEAMGGGDVKLLAMIGAFLGWQLVALTIFISALSGSLVGLAIKLKKGESYIPYGPYLALGAVISLLWGEGLINWYLYIGR